MTDYIIYGNNQIGNTANCVYSSLISRGFNCNFFDFTKFYNLTNFSVINRILMILMNRLIEKRINNSLIKKIDELSPNFLFVIKGLNIFPKTLTYAKSNGVILINWNLDDFENNLNNSTHMRKSYGLYDYVFTNKLELISLYEKLGMKNVSFIENYYIKDIHKPLNILSSQKKISFVGSWSKKREKLLLSLDREINVYGSGWKKRVLDSRKLILNGPLTQSGYVRVINESYINLNFLTQENNDTSNLRFFEVCATNSLLICEYSDRFNEYLNKDFEMTYFDLLTPNDLKNKIEYILNLDQDDYNSLKYRAHQKIIRNNHSFDDRIDQIFKIIN